MRRDHDPDTGQSSIQIVTRLPFNALTSNKQGVTQRSILLPMNPHPAVADQIRLTSHELSSGCHTSQATHKLQHEGNRCNLSHSHRQSLLYCTVLARLRTRDSGNNDTLLSSSCKTVSRKVRQERAPAGMNQMLDFVRLYNTKTKMPRAGVYEP